MGNDEVRPLSAVWSLFTPTGNRTPVSALRTQRPRPLDDEGLKPHKTSSYSKESHPPWQSFSGFPNARSLSTLLKEGVEVKNAPIFLQAVLGGIFWDGDFAGLFFL